MPGIIASMEQRADGVSLEDPNVSLGGTSIIELLGGGRITATGKRVNEKSALAHSAVYAAINIIAGTIATLPAKVYQARADGGREERRDHHLWRTLHDEPNPEMTAASWKEAGQGHLLTYGNNYNEIVHMGDGTVQLWPLPPNIVEVRRSKQTSRLFYAVNVNGERRPIDFRDMLHIPGLGFDGVVGYGPIRLARESIAMGMAADEYAARFYGNNSTPPGYLYSEAGLQEETARTLKQKWEEAQGGLDQSHRTAILHGGIKWESIGLSQQDSQFLESRKFQVREIARWFNIPPHKIRDLDNATFTNIEQQNIEFVVDTLRPWLVRWEQALAKKLLSPEERADGLYIEFAVDGLLRGDTEKRGQWYRERFNAGSITPNEIRKLENQNPIDGGDQAFIQVNMVPLNQAMAMSPAERANLLLAEQGVAAETRGVPEPEARATTPALRLGLRNAFRGVLADATGRAMAGEIRNVRRAVERYLRDESPEAFETWLEDYYFNEHPEWMRSALLPAFGGYSDAVARTAADETGKEPPSPALRENFTGRYVDNVVTGYSASSRRQLAKVVRTSLADPDASPKEAVQQRLTQWEEGTTGANRADQLARRHIVELGEATSRFVWESIGVMAVTSVAVGDSCPYCEALNGRTIGIRETFIRKGEKFQPEGADTPLTTKTDIRHPPYHAGCDCTTTSG